MTVKKKSLIGMALCGLLVLIGGAYLAYANAEKVKTVESWPTVDGYVVESAIRWHASTSSRGKRQAHSYYYRLEVRTDYMIDGRYFSATTPGIKEIVDQKIVDDDPWENLPAAEMIGLFKQVPQGTIVPVHYNPLNNSESYIFSKLPFWNIYSMAVFLMIFGAIFFLVPLPFLINGARRNQYA